MVLNHKEIILGSASPRRRELLAALDIRFTVDTDNSFSEEYEEGTPACEVPLLMSQGKSHGFHRPLSPSEILITADTVVIIDGKVLGKPHSEDEAAEMLAALSGRTHEVITGVTIRDCTKEITLSDTTIVSFKHLNDKEIQYYIKKYRPFDKAGAYGIQEWIGYAKIDKIKGSFYNVMGFPTGKIYEALEDFTRTEG